MDNVPNLPVIPEYITVHLGAPDDNTVENVRVSFPDYIKNVASSEIYPTWPEAALYANIYAQISFALNRVYTEYYRSRGYDFDITSSPAYDQSFNNGRNIFDPINEITNEIFNNYLVREGNVEPLFAEYCNGTTVTCNGMSQWGSVELANQGYLPIEIINYYYDGNIGIVRNAPIENIMPSEPSRPLRLGSGGNEVFFLQSRLNRISTNYPSIPKIPDPTGYFDPATEDAVREFQRIFDLTVDGVVGKATWYRVQYIYNAVKRLNELDSEGLTYSDVVNQYPTELEVGDTGEYISLIQYMLSYVGQYVNTIPTIAIDGIFGERTRQAVEAFQRTYELEVTGIVDEATYYTLYDVYSGMINSSPDTRYETLARPYPGSMLLLGMQSPYVGYLQEYLNTVSDVLTSIPKVEVTGVFDLETEAAVSELQRLVGLPVTGRVNAATWNELGELYNDIAAGQSIEDEQFPGYTLTQETEGS